MNVRLIKPSMLAPERKPDEPQREVSIIDRIESWVREFRSTRAARVRAGLKAISSPREK
jgi:hypothetical protein